MCMTENSQNIYVNIYPDINKDDFETTFFYPQNIEKEGAYIYYPTRAAKAAKNEETELVIKKVHAKTIGLILTLQGMVDTITTSQEVKKESKEGKSGSGKNWADVLTALFESFKKSEKKVYGVNFETTNVTNVTNVTHVHNKESKKNVEDENGKTDKKDDKLNTGLLVLSGVIGFITCGYFAYKSGDAVAKLQDQQEKCEKVGDLVSKWNENKNRYIENHLYTKSLDSASKIAIDILNRHSNNRIWNVVTNVVLAVSGFFLFTGALLLSAPIIIATTIIGTVTVAVILIRWRMDRTEEKDKNDANRLQDQLNTIAGFHTIDGEYEDYVAPPARNPNYNSEEPDEDFTNLYMKKESLKDLWEE